MWVPLRKKTDHFKSRLTSNKTILQIKKKLADVMGSQ